MKFFYPDAHDYVDPDFDFERDLSSPARERHRTDLYAHEVLDTPPFDGLLISKSIVDGTGSRSGKYTEAQKHRLHREGVHRFFRVEPLDDGCGGPFPVMGDCGAFSYIGEEVPPISIQDVIEFYSLCGFTHGQSIDHIIAAYEPAWSEEGGLFEAGPPKEVNDRFELTLELAAEFIEAHDKQGCTFVPVGVAQGWSPTSYREAVTRLYGLGYRYIAIGGLVPLKTHQIMSVLREVMPTTPSDAQIHLLGVLRWDTLDELLEMGVASVDSTSPLRQAFLDNRHNYYVGDEPGNYTTYPAIRVPQMDGNARVKQRIREGNACQDEVRILERRVLDAVRAYDRGAAEVDLEVLLDDLDAYTKHLNQRADYRPKNRRTLEARPWRDCSCAICREIGVEVILFRGANRNRRRGFHNLHVAYRRIQTALERHRSVCKAATT